MTRTWASLAVAVVVVVAALVFWLTRHHARDRVDDAAAGSAMASPNAAPGATHAMVGSGSTSNARAIPTNAPSLTATRPEGSARSLGSGDDIYQHGAVVTLRVREVEKSLRSSSTSATTPCTLNAPTCEDDFT